MQSYPRRRKNIQIGFACLGLTLIITLLKCCQDLQESSATSFPDPCGLESVECAGK